MKVHHLGLALAGILLSLVTPVHADSGGSERPTQARSVGVLVDDFGFQSTPTGSYEGEGLSTVTSYADWVFTAGMAGATGQTVGLLGTYEVDDPATMTISTRTFSAGLGGEGYKYYGSTAGPYGVLRVGLRQVGYGDPNPLAWATMESADNANIWESSFGSINLPTTLTDVQVLGTSAYTVGSNGTSLYAAKLNLTDGSPVKIRSWGNGRLTSLAVVDGSLIAAGVSDDGDMLLMRLNPTTLKPVWTKQLISNDIGTNIQIAADGTSFWMAAEAAQPWAGSHLGGSLDIVLGRYDATGKQMMSTRTGTVGDDPLSDLVVSPFGPIVVGWNRVEGFSRAGVSQWSREVTTMSGLTRITAATWSGGLVLVGSTTGALFHDPVGTDYFWLRWRASQPDLAVKPPGKKFIGTGVWELREQTASVSVKRKKSVTAKVRITNASGADDSVVVSGCRSANKVSISYSVGGTDVTHPIIDGTYLTPILAPGASTVVSVRVRPGAKAPKKTTRCQVSALSTTVPGSFDIVGIKVRVK